MTTTSAPSGSDGPGPSRAFGLLHPALQRWVYDQGWIDFRDAQERAVVPILEGRDTIVAAGTASGKTEAAFLPICSALATDRDAAVAPPADPWNAYDPWKSAPGPGTPGIEALCVFPLKALINDQFDRLEQLAERAELQVHRWHGDVTASAKRRLLRSPAGILLITPESLEALFVTRGTEVSGLFAGLRFVVVDELHSFLRSPRGAQLQSLLHRVDVAVGHRSARVGLSATLADMAGAAAYLRPECPGDVRIVESEVHQPLLLQVRGYLHRSPLTAASSELDSHGTAGDGSGVDGMDVDTTSITDHLFRTLRGHDNLVFANARSTVEIYADTLARRCAAEHIANEFWPHHGSLSKELRETVEAQLKDRTRPVTAVCTSTLELGIDIGSVTSIAQIGPPPSVAAMRQRLGRSGRRGEDAILRMYITEEEIDARSSLADQLRSDLVQTIAMVKLLVSGWLEPLTDSGLNLSTLIQQVLSVLAQKGGATAPELHDLLCGLGPFVEVDKRRFARLLRAMAGHDLVVQAADGTLLPGVVGEKWVNHYSFYAAFATPEEWRLVAGGKPLGTLPLDHPLVIGGLLIFGGRRWKIVAVEAKSRVVDLEPSLGGNPPKFRGEVPTVGDRVRAEMATVYRDSDTPPWLSPVARELLAEGRNAWARFGLGDRIVVEQGRGAAALPWTGDRALATTAMILGTAGVGSSVEGPALVAPDCDPDTLVRHAATLIAAPVPYPIELARTVENMEVDKWDWVLDPELAAEATASRLVDIDGARRVLMAIANGAARRSSDV